uniref:Phosphodiesterase n=2 Tax=Parascaris univalens TaxID=6257 RepID=A0A915BHE1_PARUN
MDERQLSSIADQYGDHVGNSGGIRFTITTHFANRNITMARSCSDLEPHAEGQCLHRSLSRGSTNSAREIQLTGQCRACGCDYKCTCCRNCNHLVVIYAPASKPRVSNITFSTVTSATGLPTIAAEPSRPRSSSYWKPHERENSTTGQSNDHSCCAHTSNSIGGGANKAHICGEGVCSTADQLSNSVRRDDASPSCASADAEGNHSEVCSRSSSEVGDDVVQTTDGTVFDTKELDNDNVLARIPEWGFPIFYLAERHRLTTLSRLAYAIFKHAGLFRIFKLSTSKFFNFFHSLERGYWDIPYHNRIHAADVLHGCFYLTVHPVKAFLGSPSTPDSPIPFSENSPLPISESMSTLELMALYTAAAMHDFDHPGRTNAFLVASEDRKAILYNDRSVLENHHAAESWRLLCKPQNAFIDTLDAAETKRFRYLVLEYILATDLKQHFDIIMQFNEKAPDMDLNNESDRVLVSEMIIKFADINSPSKPYPLHRQWTDRICEEFYEQGDEEKRRGMAVSPYMDRNEPAVAKLQDSFIAHIVSPLAVALNEVGLLPILPGLEEPELIINLKHNHQKWLQELEAHVAADVVSTSSGNVSGGMCNQSETIEEEVSNSSPNNSCESSAILSPTDEVKCESADSIVEIEEQYEMCTIHENDEGEEEYL